MNENELKEIQENNQSDQYNYNILRLIIVPKLLHEIGRLKHKHKIMKKARDLAIETRESFRSLKDKSEEKYKLACEAMAKHEDRNQNLWEERNELLNENNRLKEKNMQLESEIHFMKTDDTNEK